MFDSSLTHPPGDSQMRSSLQIAWPPSNCHIPVRFEYSEACIVQNRPKPPSHGVAATSPPTSKELRNGTSEEERIEVPSPCNGQVSRRLEGPRLQQSGEGCTLNLIAKLAGDHPENVRRYMRNGGVPVNLLANFAEAFGDSANLLVWGVGP